MVGPAPGERAHLVVALLRRRRQGRGWREGEGQVAQLGQQLLEAQRRPRRHRELRGERLGEVPALGADRTAGPPGTVMVSVAPGTSGPVAWYSSSDGDSTAHAPGTGGLRVGIGLPGARSVESCTVMVDPAATLVPVGVTEVTVRATGGRSRGGLGLVGALVVDDEEAAPGDDEHRQAHGEDHPPARAAPSPDVVSRHCSRDSTGVESGSTGGFRRQWLQRWLKAGSRR